MSWSFAAKAGSVESLKLRQRCGARPCAFQMLWTVETARPQAAAIARAELAQQNVVLGPWGAGAKPGLIWR
jgi:hypothetical protein